MSGAPDALELPAATLKGQLSAAYIAIQTLSNERAHWRTEAARIRDELQAEQIRLEQELAAERGRFEQELAAERGRLDQELATERGRFEQELAAAIAKQREFGSLLAIEHAKVAAVNALREGIAKLETINRKLTSENAALQGSEPTKLRVQVANLDAQVAALSNELYNVTSERDAYHSQLRDVLASRSWRLARPLRGGGRAVRFVVSLPRRVAARVGRVTRRLARSTLVKVLNVATRSAASWRARFGTPRTLWGVTPILTLPLLARCDRLLGLKSESLVFTTYYTTGQFDINLKRIANYIYTKHPNWAVRFHSVVLRLALIRYDVMHLFSDRGLLLPVQRMGINPAEMQAMQRFQRHLFTYAYGADVRTREVTLRQGERNLCSQCPEPGKFCMCDGDAGAQNMASIRSYATAQVSIGDMLDHVPGARNMPYWPLDMKRFENVGVTWDGRRPLRVAHAPNHPHFKGTTHLFEAVERLQAEGFAIELVKIQGVPNTEVIALFKGADLVAEQFVAGFHGYTLLEAMALGKPALVFVRRPEFMADPEACPIINTEADKIYDNLRAILEGRVDLAELGRRCRRYVERHHSLPAIAIELGRMYLETSAFSPRILRRIKKRIATLEADLPARIVAPPVVPWSAIRDTGIHQAPVLSDQAAEQRLALAG